MCQEEMRRCKLRRKRRGMDAGQVLALSRAWPRAAAMRCKLRSKLG